MIDTRKARLDNTAPISQLLRGRISTWQKLDEHGRVQDLPYEALTIYDRWILGGPWMSIETSAIWLNHLLHGNGLPIIAERDNQICGYAEVFPSNEPQPFGQHWHIAQLVADSDDTEIRQALFHHISKQAAKAKCQSVTVALSEYDTEQAALYQELGMRVINTLGRYTIVAQMGQGFYKATENFQADASQIDGWHMIAGRSESARHHWEDLWPSLWRSIDEIQRIKRHRMHFSASGQNALVVCQQHLYDPRSVDVFCWSSMPLKSQLVTAISDWAHRANYRRLTFAIPATMVKLLGNEVETHPYQQNIYALDLNERN